MASENSTIESSDQRWGMTRFYPSSGWGRFLARAPLFMWRLGLGPVAGKLFLIMTTTGRKSGLPRQAMVEYFALNGQKYITSGYGGQAQWFKNLQADPRVTIQSAGGTERMVAARVTDDEEMLAVYQLFKRKDPPFTIWYLKSLDIDPNDPADVIAHKDRIYWLRFDPTDQNTPPGLEVDLAWLWPLALLVVAGLWLLRVIKR